MSGLVKIWWHDGSVKDVRYHDIPVVGEPELGYEAVTVSPVPVSSGPAPAGTTVAIIETEVNLRYRVRPAGDTTDADPIASKPLLRSNLWTDPIGVKAGQTISFVEV